MQNKKGAYGILYVKRVRLILDSFDKNEHGRLPRHFLIIEFLLIQSWGRRILLELPEILLTTNLA
jgi:hypothetical protein